jgi:hypothetical protein
MDQEPVSTAGDSDIGVAPRVRDCAGVSGRLVVTSARPAQPEPSQRDDHGELKGIGAAGTGTRKEPKYVALQVVIDKMNDLFGAESFSAPQPRSTDRILGWSRGCE